MSNDELSIVQHVMAHKSVEERAGFVAKVGWLGVELRQRIRQAVRDLHVAALQLTDELHIMVAGDAERRVRLHHAHHKPQDIRYARTAIHQITNEYSFATCRRGYMIRAVV